MNMQVNLDAQAALSFVTSQASHIEAEVIRKDYPEIQYRKMMFVDTTANAFAASVTHFTQDMAGQAKYINGKGDDIPLVNLTRNKFEQTVDMAGIGYRFSLEEIGQAQMLGQNLSAEHAIAASDAYEQFVDKVALIGDTDAGIEGLFNTTGITSTAAGQTFTAGTPQQVLATINDAVTAIYNGSNGVEMANTVVLPIAAYSNLTTKQLAPESDTVVMDFVRRANVYTAMTGQPLNIMSSHRLTDTMVVYRNEPGVLKLPMPMPLRFIPPQADNLHIKVLGMFRFAPVSIRRPGAVRYVTGVA